MKVICDGNSKTPTEFFYLETEATLLMNIISSRRIMFLHNILRRNKEELVKRVYKAQKQNSTKGDFMLVKDDLLKIGEAFDENLVKNEAKKVFKARVMKKIRATALKELTSKQMEH